MIEWIIPFIVIFGFYLNAKKIKISWVIWTSTDTFWLIYTLILGIYPLVLLYSLGIMVDIYGIIKWYKEKKNG